MSRTLSSGLNTEVAKPITTPAYFVEIQFSTPLYLSSRGTLSWNGHSWLAHGVRVQGLSFAIDSPQQRGNLLINDLDGSVTALVLREGVASRPINIWKFYGAAPATGDPVQVFAGVGDAASADERSGGVNIALVQRGSRELFSPRRYMTRGNGFSILPVSGTKIYFNEENYKIERYRG